MMKLINAFIILMIVSCCSFATTKNFSGPDYTGIYDCNGVDNHEGPYKGKVTLKLVVEQSKGLNGAYQFKLDAEGYGTYLGEAASQGNMMAMHFALIDPTPKDFGTGIATFSKTKEGKWRFEKYYFEPEFKGGNFGTEICVMQ